MDCFPASSISLEVPWARSFPSAVFTVASAKQIEPAGPDDPAFRHQRSRPGHAQVGDGQAQGGVPLVLVHVAVGRPVGRRVNEGGVGAPVNAAEGVAVAGVGEGEGQPAVARLHGLKTHPQEGEVGRLGEQVHEGLGVLGVDGAGHGTASFLTSPCQSRGCQGDAIPFSIARPACGNKGMDQIFSRPLTRREESAILHTYRKNVKEGAHGPQQAP